MTLTDLDLAVLAFASRRYRHPSAREDAVLAEFGVSETVFEQRLGALLDDPAAFLADPVLVGRLRRVRDERRRKRGRAA